MRVPGSVMGSCSRATCETGSSTSSTSAPLPLPSRTEKNRHTIINKRIDHPTSTATAEPTLASTTLVAPTLALSLLLLCVVAELVPALVLVSFLVLAFVLGLVVVVVAVAAGGKGLGFVEEVVHFWVFSAGGGGLVGCAR